MSEARWGKTDFQRLAQAYIGDSGVFDADFVKGFLQEALHHYDDADEEGRAFVDKFTVVITNRITEAMSAQPDSLHRRQLLRAVALTRREHHSIEDIFEHFASKSEPNTWTDEATDVLTSALQVLLDVLFEVSRSTHNGPASFSMIGLGYWIIDEITVAQSIARRHYSTQAYTHLRSVVEMLDVMQIFTVEPSAAELWTSGDEFEVWKKFNPNAARQMLGKDGKEPFYSFLSQSGCHPNFTTLRTRLIRRPSVDGQVNFSIPIGGVTNQERELSILVYSTLLVISAVTRVVEAFQGDLNFEDLNQIIVSATTKSAEFFQRLYSSDIVRDWSRGPFHALTSAIEAMQKDLQMTMERSHVRPTASASSRS